MIRSIVKTTLAALMPLAACAAWAQAWAPAVADASAPQVRTLSPQERAVAGGLAPMPQVALNLRTVAAVRVWAHGRGAEQQAVQRPAGPGPAAVYRSAPHKAAALLPPTPTPAEQHDFKVDSNSVQAFATMTALGVPHLFVQGHGDFRADASAGWTSRFVLPGSTSREVVLRFVVPASKVDGNTEEDAPAWWRSRLRADLLVNGHPAWSTEALRLRADFDKTVANGPDRQLLPLLQTFGDPLDFPTDDEDLPPNQGGPANDSNADNTKQAAQPKEVVLSLGRFNPGDTLELSLILRGTAFTRPSAGKSDDHRCVQGANQWFCSRATVSVAGEVGQGPQVTLLP